MKNLLVIIIDATLDVLNVDGHNPYNSFVVTTWIWYAKNLGPFHVMSLLSGLCFKVWTSFVIRPFLGQHNVPYQPDELWLNLEERTMSQLWVHLFENSVIKSRRRINVRLLFEKRNVVSNLVIGCTDPL
jgi:hypothetical protein